MRSRTGWSQPTRSEQHSALWHATCSLRELERVYQFLDFRPPRVKSIRTAEVGEDEVLAAVCTDDVQCSHLPAGKLHGAFERHGGLSAQRRLFRRIDDRVWIARFEALAHLGGDVVDWSASGMNLHFGERR